mgnify:CR=1 FL=1
MEKLKLNLSKVVLAKTVAADLEGIEPSQYDLMVFYSPSEDFHLVSAFGVESIPTVLRSERVPLPPPRMRACG